MARRFCIHCLAPVIAPDEVCEACLELLSDLGEEDEPEPQPQPANVVRAGRFTPSQADIAAYSVMSERGSFRPFDQTRPKERPHHATNRWGKALKNWR